MSKTILGIDVSKQTLDVALLGNGKTHTRRFDNSTAGFRLLSGWLKSWHCPPAQVHVCLEATGNYSEAVARFLHEAGHLVSLVNPLRIKGFAASKMQRNKTDKADARLIAEFCQTHTPPRWLPPAPEVAELQALVRRIETLSEMRQMEQNRLELAPAATQPSVRRIIQTLSDEIKSLEKAVKQHFDNHPDLRRQRELLETIDGIGEKTAALLLSEIEFSRFESARSLAAFAGVTPRRAESGTSLRRTRLSKMGNARIRRALYFPAIVALKHNQIIKEFAARLEKNGKTPMQRICAAMRKLLHIAFGVLKHQKAFDATLAAVAA